MDFKNDGKDLVEWLRKKENGTKLMVRREKENVDGGGSVDVIALTDLTNKEVFIYDLVEKKP